MDGEGVINLGNLHEAQLENILYSNRAQVMIKGFAEHKAIEELYRKWSYKDRFQSQKIL